MNLRYLKTTAVAALAALSIGLDANTAFAFGGGGGSAGHGNQDDGEASSCGCSEQDYLSTLWGGFYSRDHSQVNNTKDTRTTIEKNRDIRIKEQQAARRRADVGPGSERARLDAYRAHQRRAAQSEPGGSRYPQKADGTRPRGKRK